MTLGDIKVAIGELYVENLMLKQQVADLTRTVKAFGDEAKRNSAQRPERADPQHPPVLKELHLSCEETNGDVPVETPAD